MACPPGSERLRRGVCNNGVEAGLKGNVPWVRPILLFRNDLNTFQ